MDSRLTPLERVDQLDELLHSADGRPLLLFKHSYTCGISAEALDELREHLGSDGFEQARYAIVTVQTHRDVSHAVATKLGVRHETPQALLIRGGRVLWSASHFRVTATAVRAALKAAAQ